MRRDFTALRDFDVVWFKLEISPLLIRPISKMVKRKLYDTFNPLFFKC